MLNKRGHSKHKHRIHRSRSASEGMAQENDDIFENDICHNFIPQQWRKTKCQLCFKDIIEHTKNLTTEESKIYIQQCMKYDEERYMDKTNDAAGLPLGEGHNIGNHRQTNERHILASTSTIVGEGDQHSYSSQLDYTHGSSKEGSSEQLDVDVEGEDSVMKDSDNDDETADEGNSTPFSRRRRKRHSSAYPFEHMDSHDAEDGSITPNRMSQKRRSRSKGKNGSNLLQLSSMVRSSNSSLCSYTSEMTDGYSDYDYDIRSITDDTDDYADIPDVMIEELNQIKPELKARVENERRVSRSRIISLERELEGQQDYYRASEVARDRQLKSLQRDIEAMKLELSSVQAHENILALKSRLELEGKSSRINDLEQQIETLKEEIDDVSKAPDTHESQQEFLNKELGRACKRITQLEEENRACEERMKLAEDLQHNDKELIVILRKQCGSLEHDLTTEQDRNTQLEVKLKLLDMIRADFLKEQEKHIKTGKETEAMRQKIKRRDRHIEDLEDDNVKLQQLKQELESNLAKKEFKIKKTEKKVSELQNEMINSNKQIADLTGENKTLEQVKRLTDLKLKDMSSITAHSTEVVTNEQFFINTLEDRLKHRESRLKELELENDNYLREIKELYDNLLDVEKQREEYKEQTKDNELKITRMRQENKHNEKKVDLLHRKLQKSEKEKRRAVNRQNNAELKLAQYQQEKETAAIAATACVESNLEQMSYDSSDDSDSRILRLKLQSTEARLSMIEVNKGYLESKVVTLERKLIDKEQEFLRLNDSMERDSGAPSQDYDRFDALERENIMLQTKLDELSLENAEQNDMVYKLKEGNEHLETTIQNLHNKLESYTFRLKELEEANHKLGREALKRNESYTYTQGEVASSLNEIKEHNKFLQDKLKHFDNVEELVERLELQINTEKTYVQWYFDENEKLKIQTAKMADTIRTLERSKFEFEQSVHELSDTNKDLNNDVKRLEQKLVIYAELFDKDSNFHTSLKRRSLQGDRQEQADEKLIENALAPLMEEIKEKDAQIRNLQKAVEEKDVIVNSLNKEIDTLESNLAAMVMEKIRNMHVSSDAEKVRQEATDSFRSGLFSTNSLQELKQPNKTFYNDIYPRETSEEAQTNDNNTTSIATLTRLDDSQKFRIGEPCTLLLSASELSSVGATTSPQTSPDGRKTKGNFSASPPKETYLALTSKNVVSPSQEDTSLSLEVGKELTIVTDAILWSNNDVVISRQSSLSPITDDELSVSRAAFYRMLQDHEEHIKKKDEQYIQKSSSSITDETDHDDASSSPRNIYKTIESAILDQYRDDEGQQSNFITSKIPSLDNRCPGESPPYPSFIDAAGIELSHLTGDVDNKSMSNIVENKALVEDMYDQLAQLEDLVTVKYASIKKTIPDPPPPIPNTEETTPATESSNEQDTSNEDITRPAAPRIPKISQRQSSRESNLGLPSNATLLCRTPSTSSSLSQDSNSIDLSGLDDLLAEVDQREGGSHETYTSIIQETKRRTASGLEHKAVVSKTMPSIRTTKRIIKFGGLNRTGSFDSTRTKPKMISSSSIISHSSSSIPSTIHRSVNVEIPANRLRGNNYVKNSSMSSLATSSSSSMASVVYVPDKDGMVSIPAESRGATPPYRRPKLEACKFLSSSDNNFSSQ